MEVKSIHHTKTSFSLFTLLSCLDVKGKLVYSHHTDERIASKFVVLRRLDILMHFNPQYGGILPHSMYIGPILFCNCLAHCVLVTPCQN